MKPIPFLTMLALAVLTAACGPKTPTMPADAIVLRSPDTQLELKFAVIDGVPTYTLDRAGAAVILPSRMGFALIGRESLDRGFTLNGSSFSTFDETWEPVWGEEAEIRNHYNELLVKLGKASGEAMNIRFRLYDDGLGFRYEFPLENKLTYFNIQEELTEFALTEDPTAWWVPGDYDIQEFCPTESRLREVRTATDSVRAKGGWPRVQSSPTGVQTALQLKTDAGLYLNIHEAATLDFPTLHLDWGETDHVLRANLTPDAEGVKGRMQAPCKTP
ncbi:MAG: glycoside hydrolase family 97 N-terminal domain-containing protein, partial [Bacteroidales bacterium]|nr:glycoside hydrolase family 97 N-terminal domain-containing protein [Bacteroidales bacterium]